MTYLLDTNAFSDLMRRAPNVVRRLAEIQTDHDVVSCVIVRGETQFGIDRMPPGLRRTELAHRAEHLDADIRCEPVDADAWVHYSRVKIACQRKGITLNENDLWIAATALALHATLVTRDRDFDQIDSLAVEDWSV